MAHYQSIKDIPPHSNAVILLRVDLNLPMQNSQIADKTRMMRILPTLKYLRDHTRCKIIIASHFGRPKGDIHPEMGMSPICQALSREIGAEITFLHAPFGTETRDIVKKAPEQSLFMLENLRFHPGEEKNDPAFVQELSALCDLYVNDAFSVSHRAHASIYGIAQQKPAYAGLALSAEIEALQAAINSPKKPVLALIGGAKISTKIDLIANLCDKMDHIILGGGMANTFLKMQGYEIGSSLCEDNMLQTAKDIMAEADKKQCQIHLPIDGVAATQLEAHAPHRVVTLQNIKPDEMILDIGPQTISAFQDIIGQAQTILWNGPMGAFEHPPFDRGTSALADFVADMTKKGQAQTIAGGGDTVSALAHAGVLHDMTYVSTAGGAFLEWLEGKSLPGIDILAQEKQTA